MAWTNQKQPFGENHAPLLTGLSSSDGTASIPVAVDPNSGAIITSGSSASLPSTFKYGQTTTTGSAVQFASNALTIGVIVQALSGNTASVYIGDASVTSSNGFELQPGQATSIAVSNTNALYVNGTSGDKVCFIGS